MIKQKGSHTAFRYIFKACATLGVDIGVSFRLRFCSAAQRRFLRQIRGLMYALNTILDTRAPVIFTAAFN